MLNDARRLKARCSVVGGGRQASVRLSLWGAIAGNTTNSFGRTPMKQSRILLAAVIAAAFAAPVAHAQWQTDAAQADRKSGVLGKRVSVRVDPGGRRCMKKNK